MSYSFEGNYRTKSTALSAVVKSNELPQTIKNVLLEAISNLNEDTDGRFIFVKACGHQCNGKDYERSNAEIVVEPRRFH